MLFTMGVSLYTSRVILQTLGVEDYGIYNVVGGVIAMISFLTNSLAGAGSRFITFTLGKKDEEKLKKLFSTIMLIHLGLALLILIFGETIGLWFVHNKLVIPDNRMTAALWVYHCSIVSAMIGVLSAPYNSLIIAHEKMSAFASISIIEVILKLLIVYLLTLSSFDKLVVYSILVLLVHLFIRYIYTIYSAKHFKESRVKPSWVPGLFREIGSYSLWTMNGYLAIIGYTQGINILLNIFFGPIVNAARGIAVQVQTAVLSFVQSFLTAINPQITKSCASQDYDYMHQLIIAASKYGYYLMMIITFPLILMIEPVLNIWLGTVPEFTAEFVKIMLYAGMLNPLCRTLVTAINATGDIKKFQIYEGTSLLMVIPVTYLLLKFFDISPEGVLYTYIVVEIITQLIRIYIVLPKIYMSFVLYMKTVIQPLLLPSLIFFTAARFIVIPSELSFIELLSYTCLSCISIGIIILILGLNRKERLMIKMSITKYLKNIRSVIHR